MYTMLAPGVARGEKAPSSPRPSSPIALPPDREKREKEAELAAGETPALPGLPPRTASCCPAPSSPGRRGGGWEKRVGVMGLPGSALTGARMAPHTLLSLLHSPHHVCDGDVGRGKPHSSSRRRSSRMSAIASARLRRASTFVWP